MASFQMPKSLQPHVLALFNDGADSFVLPRGTTLEELADRIHNLGERHAGAPIAIHVHFDGPASRQPAVLAHRH